MSPSILVSESVELKTSRIQKDTESLNKTESELFLTLSFYFSSAIFIIWLTLFLDSVQQKNWTKSYCWGYLEIMLPAYHIPNCNLTDIWLTNKTLA